MKIHDVTDFVFEVTTPGSANVNSVTPAVGRLDEQTCWKGGPHRRVHPHGAVLSSRAGWRRYSVVLH